MESVNGKYFCLCVAEICVCVCTYVCGLPCGSAVKSQPEMQELQETQIQSLGWEDPLEERAWQPSPVYLPGESHGQRSLTGYNP